MLPNWLVGEISSSPFIICFLFFRLLDSRVLSPFSLSSIFNQRFGLFIERRHARGRRDRLRRVDEFMRGGVKRLLLFDEAEESRLLFVLFPYSGQTYRNSIRPFPLQSCEKNGMLAESVMSQL